MDSFFSDVDTQSGAWRGYPFLRCLLQPKEAADPAKSQGYVRCELRLKSARLGMEWSPYLTRQLAMPVASGSPTDPSTASFVSLNQKILTPALYLALSVDGSIVFRSSCFGFQRRVVEVANAFAAGTRMPSFCQSDGDDSFLWIDRNFGDDGDWNDEVRSDPLAGLRNEDLITAKAAQFADSNIFSCTCDFNRPRSIIGLHIMSLDDTTQASLDEELGARYTTVDEFLNGLPFQMIFRFDFPAPLCGALPAVNIPDKLNDLARMKNKYRRCTVLLTLEKIGAYTDRSSFNARLSRWFAYSLPSPHFSSDIEAVTNTFATPGTSCATDGPISLLGANVSLRLRRTRGLLRVNVPPQERALCLVKPENEVPALILEGTLVAWKICHFWMNLLRYCFVISLKFAGCLFLLYLVFRYASPSALFPARAEFLQSLTFSMRLTMLAAVLLLFFIAGAQRSPTDLIHLQNAIKGFCFGPDKRITLAECSVSEDEMDAALSQEGSFRGAGPAKELPAERLGVCLAKAALPLEVTSLLERGVGDACLRYILPNLVYWHCLLTSGRTMANRLATAVTIVAYCKAKLPGQFTSPSETTLYYGPHNKITESEDGSKTSRTPLLQRFGLQHPTNKESAQCYNTREMKGSDILRTYPAFAFAQTAEYGTKLRPEYLLTFRAKPFVVHNIACIAVSLWAGSCLTAVRMLVVMYWTWWILRSFRCVQMLERVLAMMRRLGD